MKTQTVRERYLEWLEPLIQQAEHDIQSEPEFGKLLSLYDDAPHMVYELFYPCHSVTDFREFCKLYNILSHALYDDGEVSVAHVKFVSDYPNQPNMRIPGSENFIIPIHRYDVNEKRARQLIQGYLGHHRAGWKIEVQEVTAARFDMNAIDFLMNTAMPAYLALDGDGLEYFKQRDAYDKLIENWVKNNQKGVIDE